MRLFAVLVVLGFFYVSDATYLSPAAGSQEKDHLRFYSITEIENDGAVFTVHHCVYINDRKLASRFRIIKTSRYHQGQKAERGGCMIARTKVR